MLYYTHNNISYHKRKKEFKERINSKKKGWCAFFMSEFSQHSTNLWFKIDITENSLFSHFQSIKEKEKVMDKIVLQSFSSKSNSASKTLSYEGNIANLQNNNFKSSLFFFNKIKPQNKVHHAYHREEDGLPMGKVPWRPGTMNRMVWWWVPMTTNRMMGMQDRHGMIK